MPVEARLAVERAGDRKHAVAGAFEREREIAAALDPVHAEQIADALFQIDVLEIHLRGEDRALFRARKSDGAAHHPAETARLADRDAEIAIAQIGRDRGAAEGWSGRY